MANTPQDLYNASPSGFDPVMGITSNGVSESVNLANQVLSNPVSYDFGNESLSASLKRVSELKTPDFNSIYKPTLNAASFSLNGGGVPGGGKVDPFGSYQDNSESWIGDRINVDEYYTQMGEGWANLDKSNAGAIGIGGGILAGAATGAAVGSLGGPIGAAIGGVVGGILGGIEGNQVSKNIGYGYVRNKFGSDQDMKYAQQGFGGRAGAGLMNLVHSADSLTLGTLGTIAYLPQAISERSLNVLFNNEFTKLLDDYDKSSQSSNRIYHSSEYDNSSLIGKLAHSELWFEQVAPAVGFMVGAIGIGRATGLGLGAVGLGGATTGAASRAFLAETIGAAAKGETQALGRQALLNGFKNAARAELKAQTFKSMAGNMVTLLTSASPESGLEARGAMNEAQENYIKAYNNAFGRLPSSEEIANFDKANRDSGNGVFAANLAVVGLSNWLQFGDAMGLNRVVKKGLLEDSINRVFGMGVKQTIGEVSEKGIQSAVWEAVQRTKIQKLGYRALKALEAPATEGLWEEGIQHVISDTHKSYLESRFNPQATEINKSLLNAFGESFVNTYTTEAGWNDIMIGMIVGAGGTVRARGGFDVLNQRAVSREVSNINRNVQNLNETQRQFVEAQEDYLNKQAIYNNLANVSTARMGDRIGALNQQVINSDLSKKYVASGNLEQAQLAYQNAIFAKLSAERRAGLSESNKFDMDTMIENIPEDALTNLYNFRSQDQINDFKTQTQDNLNNMVEAFDAAYDMAESLNLGSNQSYFSPTQITEMAALNFFQGMHSADNANNLAQSIEQTVGINGIADSMNYYANLSGVQQRRMSELEDLQKQLEELESRHNELLNDFSTEVVKPQRQGENEAVVSELDRTNNKLAAVQSEMDSVNNRITTLTNILNSKESIPSLPFGNPASKFFDAVNLNIADSESSDVLANLKSLDRYIEHLLDTTEKTEEEVATDRNKADMIQSLVGAYKTQMGLMRSFAKAAQMVADPAYINNIGKGLFNRNKYDAIFDNMDWINNNESGFDELSKEGLKQLKENLDSGVISKYDLHTYTTNFEILRMGKSIQDDNTLNEVEPDVISKEDLQDIVNQDEEGNMTLDTSSPTYQRIFEDIAQDLAGGNTLSPNQQLVYDAIQTNEEERQKLNDRIEEIRAEIEITPSTIGDPLRNSQLAQEQRINKIAEDRKAEINERYDTLINQTNSVAEDIDALDDSITLEEGLAQMESKVGELEAQRQAELDEVDRILEETKKPTESRTIQINTELDRLNNFIESVIDELKNASRELNVETVDNFDLNPKKVSKLFNDYQELFSKEDKTNEDEAKLAQMKSLINKYGLVEGRVLDYNGTPVRLSDVLEQRNFLENEHFNTETELSPLTDSETTIVTTEAPTDEFSRGTRGGDPTVLNNYDFATFTGANQNNEVSISNITPALLIEQVLRDKDAATIDVDNNEVDLSQANDLINEGQVVRVTFNSPEGEVRRISFQLDKSRRIILPQGDLQTIEENSLLRFNPDNIIGSSGYYTLTMDVNGTQVPVRSDYDLAQLIDSNAAQRLSPGDALSFEVELNSEYNQRLLERMRPFLSSVSEEDRAKYEPLLVMATEAVDNTTRINVLKANIQSSQTLLDALNKQIEEANDAVVQDRAAYNRDVVYPLTDRATVEDRNIQEFENEISTLQARNKEIRITLNVDFNKTPYDKIVRNLEKKLGKSKLSDAQQKEYDALRKEFKDNMVIVSKDKSGNIIGVVKAFSNSNGTNAVNMDYLRSNMFDRFEQSGYTSARSPFTIPVQIVYMGVPNISSTDTGKVLYEFSRDSSDNSINPSKIMDIGYVSFNELTFNSGARYNTPYNYAQSIMRDKGYTGRKVPVVIFKHNGKEIIYPISLKESLDSGVIVSQFDDLANNKSKDFSQYINDINEFLSDNKVSPKYRLTSLNYSDDYVSQIRDIIADSEYYPSVEEFLNSRNMAQTLIDNALIDIDLNNEPFIGPKIKYALNQVPEFTSELSNDKVISDNSPIKNSVEENTEENECNIELD
jgi:hypothetical protein